jgi:hypothetical protein
MSLSEYKSPVVKKPKFGWQRYQFGNKSAAELKLSLWDANLSEVVLKNQCVAPVFPIAVDVYVEVYHGAGSGLGEIYYNAGKMMPKTPINNINELVQWLNTRHPFLGEFRPTADQLNVQLVVDRTFAKVTFDQETAGGWKFCVNVA